MSRLVTSDQFFRQLQRIVSIPEECTQIDIELRAGKPAIVRCELLPRRPRGKVRISEGFRWCSDRFRRDMDEQLLEMFGPDGGAGAPSKRFHLVES